MKAGIAIVSLAAALFALPVVAQPGPGGGAGMGPGGGAGAGAAMRQGAGPGQGRRQATNCSQSRNPESCTAHQEARKKAAEACKQCVQQKMPPPECAKSPNPQQCEQHAKVREACKDKLGPEHRACLREKLAPAR